MARTAVVAGTATAVSGGMQRRQANREAEREQAAMAEQQQAEAQQQAAMDAAANRAVAGQAAAGQAADDPVAKIKELAALKDSGMLTDQEFAAAKAKVLGV
ncbi:SHOCT domain-containing protein [Catenulispora yoronensis]